MGKRGPAPKPTALRIIDGTAKQHPERIRKGEPKPKSASTTPPAWLSGETEQKVYREMAGKLLAMRVLTDADKHALAQLAIYWVRFKELAETMTTEVTETETGYRSTDPRINSMLKIGAQVTGLLKQFGMTPSSRTGIETEGAAVVDPLEEYLSNVN